MSCVADFPSSTRTAPTCGVPNRNAGTGSTVMRLRFIPQLSRVFHEKPSGCCTGKPDTAVSNPVTRIDAPFDVSDE